MPPDFWAKAREPTSAPATKALAVTSVRSSRAICVSKELPVEPQIFIARAVINAVDHNGQALHLRIPAGGGAVVVDHRAGAVLLQLLIDRPHEPLALFRIGFHRLPVEFLLEFAVAIAGVVALREITLAVQPDVIVRSDAANTTPADPGTGRRAQSHPPRALRLLWRRRKHPRAAEVHRFVE